VLHAFEVESHDFEEESHDFEVESCDLEVESQDFECDFLRESLDAVPHFPSCVNSPLVCFSAPPAYKYNRV